MRANRVLTFSGNVLADWTVLAQGLQDGYWWIAPGLSVVGGMNPKFKLIGQLVETCSIGLG